MKYHESDVHWIDVALIFVVYIVGGHAYDDPYGLSSARGFFRERGGCGRLSVRVKVYAFLKIGYYDKVIHERVWNDIEGAIQRHETEVILPSPPDYMIVEVAHKSTQRSRLRDITQIILPRDGPEISIDGTDRICIAYRRQNTTPKTSFKVVTLGSRFAHRRGLVKVRTDHNCFHLITF